VCAGIALLIGGAVWWSRTRDPIPTDPDEVVLLQDPIPTDPDEVVLFSVDGTQLCKGSEERLYPNGTEFLYKAAVLGKVAITDPTMRREVLDAVRADIRARNVTQWKCFCPRHVLRLVKGETVVDVVICYECHNYEMHQNGVRLTGLTPAIGDDSRPLLNRILTGAGVPLAPDSLP
jgi:hypothetical protein